MTNYILIKRNELQQQADLKNFYMGEAARRKDADADTLQSSTDDKELFVMFLQRALNELTMAVALRFSSIKYNIKKEYVEITFDTTDNRRAHLLPMLKQAITDYLVNELLLHWLHLRQPYMAQPYIALRANLFHNVQLMFAKFYNGKHVRRRSTDLAGI